MDTSPPDGRRIPCIGESVEVHGCQTTNWSRTDGIVLVRYLNCRRCGLKVKTEERLTVPWDARDFMAVIVQVFPEDAVADVTTLQTQSFLDEDLSRLNVHLVPHGWQLDLVLDQGQVVGVVRRRL